MSKLIVSLSPHAHGTDTVERNMYGVIIAMMPALLVSFYFFGLGSVIVTATSVAACVFFEWAISKYILRQERLTICDGSAILTGLLLAFNLPSNLPAIGVAKMTFGGLGNNLFNPALVGRAALLVAFPAQMTTWPKRVNAAAVSTATRPVTQAADAAVNRLSARPMLRPLSEDAGSASKAVPSRIMPRKPRTRMVPA